MVSRTHSFSWCWNKLIVSLSEASIMIFFVPSLGVFNQNNLLSSPVVTQLRAFIDPGIVLSMFMLSCIFVIVCGLFVWKRVYVGLFIYVLSLEIQLSKRNGYDPSNWSSHAIYLDLDSNFKWHSFSKRWSLTWLFVLLIFVD